MMMDYSFDNFEVNESRITLNKDEEIKKLTLEEDLSEIKRAQIILMKGQQRQKQAVIYFPSIFCLLDIQQSKQIVISWF